MEEAVTLESCSKAEKEEEFKAYQLHLHCVVEESPSFKQNELNDLEKQINKYFKNDNNYLNQIESIIDDKILNEMIKQEIITNKYTLEKLQDFLYRKKESPLFQTPRNNEYLKIIAAIPHNDKLWNESFVEAKKNQSWTNVLWMLIQHQTVHLITNIYKFPFETIRKHLEIAIGYNAKNRPKEVDAKKVAKYGLSMEIGTVNGDCIVCGMKLKKLGFNPIILNLANQFVPAAAKHIYSEGGTQEENLFKRTTLYLSLWPHRQRNKKHKSYANYNAIWENDNADDNNADNNDNEDEKKEVEEFYPMDDFYGAIYSPHVYIFRGTENNGYPLLPLDKRCVMSFITIAANAHYGANDNTLSDQEIEAYKYKIRAIYRIAYENGHDALVLGALGCGIFCNPPEPVAKLFYDILVNEFNGVFQRVVFAILLDHNSTSKLLQSFTKYFPENKNIY